MIYLDFQFTQSNERQQRVFCCSLQVEDQPIENYWLLDQSLDAFKKRMQALEGETRGGYKIAEIRCFLSLGIDPDKYQWIDLHAEFRQLVNETDWKYGWQWHQDKKTEKWKKKYYFKYDEPKMFH